MTTAYGIGLTLTHPDLSHMETKCESGFDTALCCHAPLWEIMSRFRAPQGVSQKRRIKGMVSLLILCDLWARPQAYAFSFSCSKKATCTPFAGCKTISVLIPGNSLFLSSILPNRCRILTTVYASSVSANCWPMHLQQSSVKGPEFTHDQDNSHSRPSIERNILPRLRRPGVPPLRHEF